MSFDNRSGIFLEKKKRSNWDFLRGQRHVASGHIYKKKNRSGVANLDFLSSRGQRHVTSGHLIQLVIMFWDHKAVEKGGYETTAGGGD